MSGVEILETTLLDLNPRWFRGASLDVPEPGPLPANLLPLEGWIVPLGRRAVSVEALLDDPRTTRFTRPLRSFPVSQPRPDVAARFPGADGAEVSGFSGAIGLLGITGEFSVHLQATLADGLKVPLGLVRGRRAPIAMPPPKHRPLLVTALTRSGTTWMMHLLSQHPQILSDGQYPYETRAARHWLHAAGVLGAPGDLENATDFHLKWIAPVVGSPPHYRHPALPPEMATWMGTEDLERLAIFSQRSIDGFYGELARLLGKPEAVYFAEKQLPDRIPDLCWEVFPSTREIFLVRDFRDRIASNASFRRNNETPPPTLATLLDGGAVFAEDLLASFRRRAVRAHLVRYEDLLTRPGEQLLAILEYLELDRSPSTVNEMLRRAQVETPWFRDHRTAANDAASIGRWRRDLDDQSRVACEESHAPALRAFGYSLEEPAAAAPIRFLLLGATALVEPLLQSWERDPRIALMTSSPLAELKSAGKDAQIAWLRRILATPPQGVLAYGLFTNQTDWDRPKWWLDVLRAFRCRLIQVTVDNPIRWILRDAARARSAPAALAPSALRVALAHLQETEIRDTSLVGAWGLDRLVVDAGRPDLAVGRIADFLGVPAGSDRSAPQSHDWIDRITNLAELRAGFSGTVYGSMFDDLVS